MPKFPFTLLGDGSPQTWTNMPSAEDNFRGFTHNKTPIDFTTINQVQLTCFMDVTAGVANSIISIEYTTDLTGATGWAELANSGLVSCPCDAVGANNGSVTAIHASAKGSVLIRIRGSGGNGTVDPTFGMIVLWLVRGE